MRKLISALGLKSGALSEDQKNVANVERIAGDNSRDSKMWKAAASHYRSYLEYFPRDFSILVQYGHALKESGSYGEAEVAYARALEISREDADLHLNYGHLKKIRGDLASAAKFYKSAYFLEPTVAALREVSAPALAVYLTASERNHLHSVVTQALACAVDGLVVTRTSDVVPLGDMVFEFTSNDPWLELSISEIGDQIPFGELSVTVTIGDGSEPARARLYVDYGGGYREDRSVSFLPGSGQPAKLILIAPQQIKRLRLDPDEKSNTVRLDSIAYRPIGDIDALQTLVSLSSTARRLAEKSLQGLKDDSFDPDTAILAMRALHGGAQSSDYEAWLDRWITPIGGDYDRIEDLTQTMAVKPMFSFVMPVYNTPSDMLIECIDSMLKQTYKNFEICIADDNSSNPEIKQILQDYEKSHSNIKVCYRESNGHISAASNSALDLASGDFIVLIDHDDLIPDYALFTVATYLNENLHAKIFYSDEDKISMAGERSQPYFKSGFNQFLMFGHNMVSHLGVYERELVESVRGFRKGFEGSQDYDLFLRCFEKIDPAQVIHIPHVLYHWRTVPGSTAISADQKGYAITAAQRALNGHFERTDLPLRSVDGYAPGVTAIASTYEFRTPISIIIPTRDGLKDLSACVASIRKNPHENVEIIVIDNCSQKPETLRYLDRLKKAGIATVLDYPHEFNFSDINNFGAQHASGELLCFLNNDTEVISPNWLDRARTLLSISNVGMVGARLLYPDGTLQHYGIGLGMADHKVASSPHLGLPSTAHGYFSKAQLIQEFSAVTAACMFIRRADFLSIGGFDPSLRVAYNDVELCIRVRETGMKIVCDPEILLTHKESKTRGSDADGEKAKRLDAEADYIREKWGHRLDHDPYYSPNHSLMSVDFTMAEPPRVPVPWRT